MPKKHDREGNPTLADWASDSWCSSGGNCSRDVRAVVQQNVKKNCTPTKC